jgi:hypothetical protein
MTVGVRLQRLKQKRMLVDDMLLPTLMTKMCQDKCY